jgi:TrpR-related protein YerC/YecD
MHKKPNNINQSLKKQIQKSLAETILDLKNISEANQFLSDFLTEAEYETLAKRMAIAYWLKKGRSYKNIKDNLKVSSATIATVQSLMDKPGFKLSLRKLEAEEWANQWAKRIRGFVAK